MQVFAKDYELHLVANTPSSKLLMEELPLKAVYCFPIERGIHPINDVRCLIQIIRFFRGQEFDAIHSVSPKAGLMAMLGGYVAGVPCVYTPLRVKYGRIKVAFFVIPLK